MRKLLFGDLIIAGAVLLLAAGIALVGANRAMPGLLYAHISINGGEEVIYSLSGEDRIIELTGYDSIGFTIEISGGAARFAYSDCPDKLCVRTGWLDSSGGFAVCLPARATLSISGYSGMDGISR